MSDEKKDSNGATPEKTDETLPTTDEKPVESVASDENTGNGDDQQGLSGEDTVPDIQAQLGAVETELKETKERLLRIAADYENFRKRSKREQEESLFRGREEVLKELLVVFDNLERATEAAGTHVKDEASSAIVEGVNMVQKQFADGLGRFGLEKFESVGKVFDPNFHEAISQEHSDEHPPGVVVKEYQKGYMLGQRLLRAAMVVVSSPSSTGTAEEEVQKSADEDGQEVVEAQTTEEEGSA